MSLRLVPLLFNKQIHLTLCAYQLPICNVDLHCLIFLRLRIIGPPVSIINLNRKNHRITSSKVRSRKIQTYSVYPSLVITLKYDNIRKMQRCCFDSFAVHSELLANCCLVQCNYFTDLKLTSNHMFYVAFVFS